MCYIPGLACLLITDFTGFFLLIYWLLIFFKKVGANPVIYLTSKPIEPTRSTLKADLAVFVNSNMLIMNIIGKNAQGLCVSSTPASKFEFLELPDRHG